MAHLAIIVSSYSLISLYKPWRGRNYDKLIAVPECWHLQPEGRINSLLSFGSNYFLQLVTHTSRKAKTKHTNNTRRMNHPSRLLLFKWHAYASEDCKGTSFVPDDCHRHPISPLLTFLFFSCPGESSLVQPGFLPMRCICTVVGCPASGMR